MKLTEIITLTKSHYASVGVPIQRYSITDEFIDKLVKNLHESGLDVSIDYSEKKVKYRTRTGSGSSTEKTVTVPLATKVPNYISPIAFYLRDGKGLELELRNFDSVTQQPRRGVIEGTFAGDFGVVCKLSITAETVDVFIVDEVRGALCIYC